MLCLFPIDVLARPLRLRVQQIAKGATTSELEGKVAEVGRIILLELPFVGSWEWRGVPLLAVHRAKPILKQCALS